MSDSGKAVFLSYASQDAGAAKKICEALRAAGVEVWFDQSELVGGDQWDAKIRGQIGSCALFLPVVSANTQARREGYFRIEWKLAAQRTHAMADGTPFLIPVVIDETKDAVALVPAEFKAVQWTKLGGGEPSPAFVIRVRNLLGGEIPAAGIADPGATDSTRARPAPPAAAKLPKWLRPILASAVLVIAVLAFTLARRPSQPEKAAGSPDPFTPAQSPPPAVPPYSAARQLVEKAWQLSEASKNSSPDGLRAAGDLAEKATQLDSTDAEVWAMAGMVDTRCWVNGADRTEKRGEMARTKILRAKGLAPRSTRVRMAEAKMLTELDLYPDGFSKAKAEAILRELLQENLAGWERTEVLGVLGKAISLQGRGAEAVKFLEQAGQTDPGWMNAASWTYLSVKMFPEALAAARRQTEMDRNAGLLQQVMIQLVREDLAAARAALDQLPDATRTEELPASARVILAFFQRDAAAMQAAGRSVPGDFIENQFLAMPKPVINGYADVFAGRLGAARVEFDAALAVVDQRLAVDRKSFRLLTWKIWLLQQLGRAEEAEQAFRMLQQLRGGPGHGNESYDLASLGRKEEALARLETELRNPLNLFGHMAARLDPVYDLLRGDPRFEQLLRDTLPPGAKPFDDDKPAVVAPVADAKSVAVLAFANLSDDKANEYFSDGISEELLNVLAKVPGLKVTARTSSFHFKGKDTPIPEIARQLGVAYVIEGSVRKAGDKVRITAQLIKAADGFHVWSDTFTRDMKDIFAVQDEIAGLIAKNLELKLGGSVRTASPINPAAFELYAQARRAWSLRSAAGFAEAEELLTRALLLEPDLARAHAALADVWMLRAIANGVIDTFGQREAPIFAQITSEIQKALALDPDSAEARASWGLIVRLQQWDLAKAEREFRRAVELNPNYATAHQWLGTCLIESGRVDEGVVESRRAAELDPFSLRILQSYAQGLVYAGRPEEALAVLGRAEAVQAKAPLTLYLKAEALRQLGRRAEAVATARELEGTPRMELLAKAGEKAEAEAALAEAEGWARFQLLTALGRTGEALAKLQAEEVPGSEVGNWLLDPRLDPFRQDPHFVKLLETLGLTEAHARMQAWRAAQPAQSKP